jgi:hypothetical protein
MSLTIACVWVQGHVPYGVEYVARLASSVRRSLARPSAFVCLTDQPRRVPAGVIPLEVPSPRPLKGWWSKIELFRPSRFTGRVLFLDLDSLIVDQLDPIVDYPAPFALVPHTGKPAGTFPEGREGLTVVKRFNSSVMVWDADGHLDRLCTDWSPRVAARLWGDQDWIGEQLPDAAAMPMTWFPRVSQIEDGPVPADAKVVLCKKPKNVIAARQWPWVQEAWQ